MFIFKKVLIVNRYVCNYVLYVLLSMFVFCEICECIYEYWISYWILIICENGFLYWVNWKFCGNILWEIFYNLGM